MENSPVTEPGLIFISRPVCLLSCHLLIDFCLTLFLGRSITPLSHERHLVKVAEIQPVGLFSHPRHQPHRNADDDDFNLAVLHLLA